MQSLTLIILLQVLAQLRSKVEIARRLLPILTALSNPALRKHHWSLLAGIVGSQDILQEATTPQQLLDLQVPPGDALPDVATQCSCGHLQLADHALKRMSLHGCSGQIGLETLK